MRRAAAGATVATPGDGALVSFKDWTTSELVVAAVLAVAVGVIFWGWGLLWSSVFQVIPFPFSYALIGVWMVGGLLVPYVIRRPGAALIGELVAAFVSMALGNQWGVLTMASGLVQGAGAELSSRASAGNASRDRPLWGRRGGRSLQHPPRHVRVQLLPHLYLGQHRSRGDPRHRQLGGTGRRSVEAAG